MIDAPTHELIDTIDKRGDSRLAISLLRSRMPWWRRFQLSDRIWGLSTRWFCVCPWNGDTAWITLPFLYFGAGKMNVELRIGGYKYGVTFDIRWRWE